MLKNIKSQFNLALTRLKQTDSKFRITKINPNNTNQDDLAFGNKFDILTKINPELDITFTIIDETRYNIIMSYQEKQIFTFLGIDTNQSKIVTKHYTFNKKEFLKQLSHLKSSQQSWDESISKCFSELTDCPRIDFRGSFIQIHHSKIKSLREHFRALERISIKYETN